MAPCRALITELEEFCAAPDDLLFVYFTRLCPEALVEELAPAPDELLAVLGLGGRLFGALDGRPPTEVFVAD